LFWVRWLGLVLGAGFTIFAHIVYESPYMQYAMWAYNQSSDPSQADVHNLLGLQSSAMGVVAAALAMTLNLLLVAAGLSVLWDGAKRSGSPNTPARQLDPTR